MRSTIKDVYPQAFEGDGIFTDMQALDVPWKDEDIAENLDILYANHSGDRPISKLVYKHLENGTVSALGRSVIALSVLIMYKTQWERLYSVLSAEYSPISNYDMVETESGTNEVSRASESRDTRTETGTRTVSDTGTVSDSGTNSTDTGVFGFNSTEDVPSDTASGTNSNQETRNLTRTETPNISEVETGTDSGTESGEHSRTLTRRGNIGVTTSQQLLQSEIELWKWSFFDQVFEDLDRVLTLQVY